MKALHIHHDANSSPGLIGELVSDRGIDSVRHQVCLQPGSPAGNPEFPNPAEFDLIFLYGSRWSVYEEAVAHWVTPELEFLRQADAAGVAVLGMCFGGQLLSAAHGGGVAPGHTPEIGWLSIESIAESGHTVDIDPGPWMQWHFDCFQIPDGAQALAYSDAGPQAFILRKNLAVQFHPEVNRLVLEEWLEDDLDQLADLGVDPEPLLTEADRQRDASRERAARLLDDFLPSRSAKNENVFYSHVSHPGWSGGTRTGGQMPEEATTSGEEDVLRAPLVLEYPFKRTTGPVIGAFLTALREGRFIGIEDDQGKVLCPPVEYDPASGASLTKLVPVGSEGEVLFWSWNQSVRDGQPLDHPFAWAMVKLDGADTPMMHAVDAPHDAMVTGLRVRAKFAEERIGSMDDLLCFEPVS